MSQAQEQEHQRGQVSHHGRQTGYAVEIERREERGEIVISVQRLSVLELQYVIIIMKPLRNLLDIISC